MDIKEAKKANDRMSTNHFRFKSHDKDHFNACLPTLQKPCFCVPRAKGRSTFGQTMET